MAQYIGFVSGTHGEVSRLGSKKSGMQTIARGWGLGGAVQMFHRGEGETSRDVVSLRIVQGSNGGPVCMVFEGTAEDAEALSSAIADQDAYTVGCIVLAANYKEPRFMRSLDPIPGK